MTRIVADHMIPRDVVDLLRGHGHARCSAAWGVSASHSGILIVPQGWLFHRTAEVVDTFIRSGVDLSNQLYRLRTDLSWHRRPLRGAPMPDQ
jgi:hypothetical protein